MPNLAKISRRKSGDIGTGFKSSKVADQQPNPSTVKHPKEIQATSTVVDAKLLDSVALEICFLWTYGRRLNVVSKEMGVAWRG